MYRGCCKKIVCGGCISSQIMCLRDVLDGVCPSAYKGSIFIKPVASAACPYCKKTVSFNPPLGSSDREINHDCAAFDKYVFTTWGLWTLERSDDPPKHDHEVLHRTMSEEDANDFLNTQLKTNCYVYRAREAPVKRLKNTKVDYKDE